MKNRERVLGFLILGCIVLFGLVIMIKGAIGKPLKAIDNQITQLQVKLQSINTDRSNFFTAEKTLQEYGKTTLADNVDQANSKAGALLNSLIAQVGLNENEFTRIPAGPTRLTGAKEVGWSVQGEGPLKKIIDLLFLLEQTPVLHRIQNMTLSPADNSGRVRVRFRYLTLTLDPSPGNSMTNVVPALGLDSQERGYYGGIVQRDLFRPYIKKTPSQEPASQPSKPAENSWGGLKIVSLSQWAGKSEAHILDQGGQQSKVYHVGDSLADGVIAAIDYRPLAKPGGNGLLSFSRIILKSGENYWAIEGGQSVGNRYQMTLEQLPPELQISKISTP